MAKSLMDKTSTEKLLLAILSQTSQPGPWDQFDTRIEVPVKVPADILEVLRGIGHHMAEKAQDMNAREQFPEDVIEDVLGPFTDPDKALPILINSMIHHYCLQVMTDRIANMKPELRDIVDRLKELG